MQKKRKLHTYFLFVFLVAVLVFISACSGGNNNNNSTSAPSTPSTPAPSANDGAVTEEKSSLLSDTPVSFRWFIAERRDAPIQNDWEIIKKIFESTNVQIDFEVVPENGLVEKQQIMLATNSVTDFMPINHVDARVYGPDGVFLNLNDYTHLTPNINAFFEQYPDAKAMVTADDGGIYSMPTLAALDFNYTWIVRGDLMDEYGINNPTNPNEFYEMLKIFKQNNPDSYPLIPERNSFDGGFTLFTAMLKMFSGLEGYIPFDPSQGKYVYAPEHPGFRDTLEYMHKLNQEQLLDPEFAIITSAQWDERMLSGKSYVTWYWKTRIKTKNKTAASAGTIPGYEVRAIPMFGADGVEVYQFARARHVNAGTAISNSVHDKETAVKFLDYLIGDEGSNYTALGIEGVTYEMVDGQPRYLEAIGDLNTSRAEFGIGYNRFNFNQEKTAIATLLDEGEIAIEEMYAPFVKQAPGALILTDAENEKFNDLYSNLKVYIDQKVAEFIANRTPINDNTIQDFINTSKSLGSDEILEIYNTAHQRAYGSN